MENSLPQRPVIYFDTDKKLVGLTDTKLGGVPYLPEGDSWPMNGDEPYSFVAQFDLAEVERIRQEQNIAPLLGGALPTTGLLQFFLLADEDMTYGLFSTPAVPNPAGSDSHVRYYADTSKPAQVAKQFNGEEWSEEATEIENLGSFDDEFYGDFTVLTAPAYPIALVPGQEQLKFNVPEPFYDVEYPEEQREDAVQLLLDGESMPEARSESYEFLEKYRGKNSLQLGGFPQFVQADPRQPDTDAVLLLQLNEDQFLDGLQDGATMQFFITEEDLRAGRFERAWMYWSA